MGPAIRLGVEEIRRGVLRHCLASASGSQQRTVSVITLLITSLAAANSQMRLALEWH